MKIYKLNNIEVSEVELKKLIQDNPELLKEENKSKYFTPEVGENFYSVTRGGGIDVAKYDEPYSLLVPMGVYRTKEEAELARDKQLALVRMWNYADKNYYFRPDWNNDKQEKYVAYYEHKEGCFDAQRCTYFQYNFLLPHLKSLEDCRQFIKDNQKDLELFIK